MNIDVMPQFGASKWRL